MTALTPADLPPSDKIGFPWSSGSTAIFDSESVYPRITVVTPSYNQGDFLEATIRSVLLQGYPNLEYIVMDGGSTDNSPVIIEKYAVFLADWVSEPDGGQTHAINKGFQRSTGDIMGWLNSDDILLPDALFHIASAYRRDAQMMASCGFRRLIDAEGKIVGSMMRGIPGRYQLRYRNVIAQETAYWRREVWEAIGTLDESKRFAMDYEYWQRILAAGYEIKLLPYYLGGFRWHEESKSATLDAVRQEELSAIYQQYGVGEGEKTVIESMGRLWALRYDLTKDLSHQRIFNHPHLAMRVMRWLENPLLSPILYLYALYRWLRKR